MEFLQFWCHLQIKTHSFSAWNSLPDYLRDLTHSVDSFHHDLKTLFSHSTSVHSALGASQLCAIQIYYWHWHWHWHRHLPWALKHLRSFIFPWVVMTNLTPKLIFMPILSIKLYGTITIKLWSCTRLAIIRVGYNTKCENCTILLWNEALTLTLSPLCIHILHFILGQTDPFFQKTPIFNQFSQSIFLRPWSFASRLAMKFVDDDDDNSTFYQSQQLHYDYFPT